MNNKYLKNMKGDELKKFITKNLAPKLRELGFKGEGFSFQKFIDPHYIHTIQIFGDKYGGEAWLEVGVHIDFLPDSTHCRIEPEKINTIDSFIRKTLYLPNGNQMIDYGSNEDEAKESIDLMYQMLEKEGFSYFNHFTEFPKPFDRIEIEDLKSNNPEFKQYELSFDWIVTALNLARINLWIGDEVKAKSFAEYGLSKIVDIQGEALICLFERILEGDRNFCYTKEELKKQEDESNNFFDF